MLASPAREKSPWPASANSWQIALAVTALTLAWQALIVHGYFHGHWSALFYAGDRFTQSQPVRAESTYVLPRSDGYDGQFYHAIAHDPLDLEGTDRFIDAPHIRYSRILVPALSYALGGGRLLWIDRAYRGLELMFLFLGVYCASSWAEGRNRSVWWGAAFVLLPGVFISLERQLADLPLCALLAIAILSEDRGRNTVCWVALVLAGLTREMGFVAIAGFVFSALREKRFRQAGAWTLAAIPGALWNAYAILFIPQTTGSALHPAPPVLSIFTAAWHLQRYPFGAGTSLLLHALDIVALLGLFLSFALSLPRGGRKTNSLAGAGFALACFGIVVSGTSIVDYTEVYSFARQASPLLLVQLFQAIEGGSAMLLWPLVMMLPRSLVINASMTFRSIFHFLGG